MDGLSPASELTELTVATTSHSEATHLLYCPGFFEASLSHWDRANRLRCCSAVNCRCQSRVFSVSSVAEDCPASFSACNWRSCVALGQVDSSSFVRQLSSAIKHFQLSRPSWRELTHSSTGELADLISSVYRWKRVVRIGKRLLRRQRKLNYVNVHWITGGRLFFVVVSAVGKTIRMMHYSTEKHDNSSLLVKDANTISVDF